MSRLIDAATEHAISTVCNATTALDAFRLYAIHHDQLSEWKFLLRDEIGTLPSHAVHREFEHGATINSVFGTAPVFMLDQTIYRNMLAGDAKFYFDFSIALDTQAVSHLHPYISGRDAGDVDPDLKEVFAFIARPDVNVDAMPYLLENVDKAGLNSNVDLKIRDKLLAYEVLRTLDPRALKDHDEVRSVLTESELSKSVDIQMARLSEYARDERFLAGLAQQYQFVYACLLKMVMLRLGNHRSSVDRCIEEFTQFCHGILATIAGRELVLCRWLLSSKRLPKFFGKLNGKRIDALRNMAWDLFHIRQMEQRLSLNLEDSASFFFSALLTFDRGMSEIIDLYPLRAVACHRSRPIAIPFFANEWRDQIAGTRATVDAYKERFFSEQALLDRSTRLETAKRELYTHIRHLEQQLVEQHGFTPGRPRNVAAYPYGWGVRADQAAS